MPLNARPYLVDNDQVEHAEALEYLLKDHDERHPLAVATGYVNLGGLRVLAAAVSDGRATRLLLGAAPSPGLDAELPLSKFTDQLAALRGERDFSRFPPSRAAQALASVDEYLSRDDVEVRRYTTTFLHGKAYLLGTSSDGRAALVSSANLTGAGMYSNRELGLVDYQPPVAAEAIAWFDRMWADANPYKDQLRDLLFPSPPVVTPEDIYLRTLLELYGDELFETSSPPPRESHVVLASFQRDGYERARAILERHHGVVYADGVGTGKTEVGLALIEEYALRQGRHALVIAPAQLRSMWERRISETRLPAQVVSFQELTSDEQLADRDRPNMRRLHVAKDSYRLIIVDEAHALRNAGTTWYRAMARLLGGERKDIVLLTATPINNGLWDLFNLVMLFARHDRALAPAGIDSIRALFLAAGANERDAEALNPDRLFPLADAVSVRRDRTFIVENYPGATFPDGTPLRFPTPVLRTRRYDIDAAHPGLVEAVAVAIGALTMARYRPSAYERGVSDDAGERALAGLLQSAVLKRFESCWAACLATVRRMIVAHKAFLTAWDAGQLPSLATLRDSARLETEGTDLASWLDELASDEGSRPATDFEPIYREHIAADLEQLRAIESALAELQPEDDPKLALLADVLRATPGKVIVFATYGETVKYLDDYLDLALGTQRERVVIVGSDTSPDERTARLARLCPNTVVEPGYQPPDGEVDLVLSTDVVSEGQNLQQAGAVVSYDMPWNPQRVVQRNGRVIRLRSPHETVALTTMLPSPGELETLLRLEARIQAKIAAAGVFGMETAVVEGAEHLAGQVYADMSSLAERLAAGDESLLDEGEDLGGSFAGEHLRAMLIRAAAEGELDRLRNLPFGIGAAFRQGMGVPSRGPSGVFFACRTTEAKGNRRYWRYVTEEGIDTEELVLLRRIEPGRAGGVTVTDDLEPAWSRAAADIVAEHNARADPAVTEDRLPPSQRWALALMRDPSVPLPAGADEAYDLLAVPRGAAVKTALAEVQRGVVSRSLSRDQAAEAIVAIVREFGLTPVPPQPVLEPITEDDIGVVCWMRVLPPA
ncbi:helicase-related protein [Mycobacterium sp. pUA109]|uniref:helicase-related protein n=1 Tax=Mycobacterium sp. pUA109 TaxID=3238982 RepID=UPI00351AEBC2